ncbi:ATP-binding protein [Parasutterella secunda]|uniref:ATP-binding protein n=1 Tax=Parasutterella secunda TaxID=626947 RepID=UPI0025A4C15A|nr:ATP-binding protein [Parasutterella secunda]MDM8112637.1 ATP-binding protein [Parasutterella secunda]MDM8218354.1 ATP-binding protein [Parasutterella secunda]
MYRKVIEQLKEWKKRSNRKPLVICGARQVGKTWLMKEFGAQCYKSTVYVNFENNEILERLFSGNLDVKRLIQGLELYAGKTIDPENTLIIFDEIQEVPKALTSLKYFNENAPEYQIVCAGSLLGIALHPGTSFPVGKVDFLNLYPLSFFEFLLALGKEKLVDVLKREDFELANLFKSDLAELLRQYFYVGGMPEAVFTFAQKQDYKQVRDVHKRILFSYEQDFSKHAPNETVPKIRLLWNSIVTQLAKENKKFFYGLVREGARAKDFESAMMWLSDCGLVYKVHRASVPRLPLKLYEDSKIFKLFGLDVGLLSAMAELDAKILLEGNVLFTEFKGALTEQYVLQELKANTSSHICYWAAESSRAELDFLIGTDSNIVPIEVKAEVNLKAKSLRIYKEKYGPKVCVRTSLTEYKDEDWLINLPLWSIAMVEKQISSR